MNSQKSKQVTVLYCNSNGKVLTTSKKEDRTRAALSMRVVK